VKFTPTELPDVVVVDPDVHRDARGFFLETYHRQKYAAGGITAAFVQDNHSRSGRGTLRGLHAQVKRPQGKLIRVVEGEIYDVALDIRRGSATFGRAVGMIISGEDFRQLWVPPGFAHGFCVLSEVAHVEYKCTEPYDAADEISILWNDPDLDIAWPIRDPTVSAKDSRAPRLREVASRL